MKTSTEDRTFQPDEKNPALRWTIILLVILAALLAGYFYLGGDTAESTQQPVTQPPPLVDQDGKPLPEIPVIEVKEPDFILPRLNESDGEFRTRLIEVNEDIAPWLQSDELIRRTITFNDGLSRGQVPSNLLSLPAPEGKFQVEVEGDEIFLAESNYKRYEYLTSIIESTDVNKLAKVFHLFRPLMEKAYGELGYPPGSLGGSVILTLDQILATPVIEEPIKLQLKSVYYSYADPELEKLKPLQKQLLRMGPETTRMMQEKARKLRATLLPAQAEQPEQ